MDPQDSTVANADLWTKYFRDEWGRWLRPASRQEPALSAVAESTAAQVASFLTLVAAGPIAWLYSANTPARSQIERRATDPVRIAPEARPDQHVDSAA